MSSWSVDRCVRRGLSRSPARRLAGLIVLDACILIAHLDAADVHHTRATALLLSTASNDEDVAATPTTLAEVLVGPARAGRIAQAVAALRQLGVISVDLPIDAPAQLAELRVATGLKMPDCCVLLAAMQTDAALATFDAAVEGRGHAQGSTRACGVRTLARRLRRVRAAAARARATGENGAFFHTHNSSGGPSGASTGHPLKAATSMQPATNQRMCLRAMTTSVVL